MAQAGAPIAKRYGIGFINPKFFDHPYRKPKQEDLWETFKGMPFFA